MAGVHETAAELAIESLNREHRSALEAAIQFDRLVGEQSAHFSSLPAQAVDQAIHHSLGRIVDALDLDRGSIFRLNESGTDLVLTHRWDRPNLTSLPANTSASAQFPWSLSKILAGEMAGFTTVDEVPDERERESIRRYGTKSRLSFPISIDGKVVGCIGFSTTREHRTWSPEVLERVRLVALVFGNALAREQADQELRASEQRYRVLADELAQLRDQLQAENVYLQHEAKTRMGTGVIVGQSAAIKHVLNQIEQVAATDSTVLLLGETGTGKELFATRIHELSARHGRAMVRINCSAIPATLIESELFGREKGAFTGALARQIGRFELADHSTIFLDEIGDLPAEMQVKLLRVLEERQIERLGSPRSIHIDTRIIVATHRDLEKRIAEGAFREDLFYRLNVFPINVPPLRERRDDIPLLVWRFVDEFSKAFAKRIDAIPRENMAELQQYAWPGNIRELRNVVERAMIVASGPKLTIPLPATTPALGKRSNKLADVEREHIRKVLESTGWRVRGAGGAAERLGVKPTTLETRLAKLGLTRPKG